ncbi:MAG: flavodoxin domain-containing protein [Spirochaetota bacterium]
MSLAILYTTKYGSTRIAAETIARRCAEAGASMPEVLDVGSLSRLPEVDTIVIGAPVYGGSIPRPMRAFVESHIDGLLDRSVALFLSCLYTGDRAEQQLADNYPSRLVAHSLGRYYVGGRIRLGELRWLDRLIMKRVGGVDHDVDSFNDAEINRLVRDVAGAEQGG